MAYKHTQVTDGYYQSICHTARTARSPIRYTRKPLHYWKTIHYRLDSQISIVLTRLNSVRTYQYTHIPASDTITVAMGCMTNSWAARISQSS